MASFLGEGWVMARWWVDIYILVVFSKQAMSRHEKMNRYSKIGRQLRAKSPRVECWKVSTLNRFEEAKSDRRDFGLFCSLLGFIIPKILPDTDDASINTIERINVYKR